MNTSTPSLKAHPLIQDFLEALGGSLQPWARQCHAACVHLIRSGVLDGLKARVARGFAKGVRAYPLTVSNRHGIFRLST